TSGNKHAARTRYTTTREGRSRSRDCTALVALSAASTISKGTSWVSSPRWPGANRPPATVTTRVMAHCSDSGASGPCERLVLVDCQFYRGSASHVRRNRHLRPPGQTRRAHNCTALGLAMELLRFSGRLPQCSRCLGDLIMSGVAPQNDKHGRLIHLELCPACDTGDVDRPAVGPFLLWFADGGGHDESRVKEGAHLLMEWTKECMAAHGWYQQDAPPDQP